jgi:hypothetical protein
MIGLEKQSPIIEDLRKHSSSQIAELRLLLTAGLLAARMFTGPASTNSTEQKASIMSSGIHLD